MASKSKKNEPEKMEVDEAASKKTNKEKPEPDADEEKKPIDVDAITFENLREHCRLIERGEGSKEPRFLARVLRLIFSTRKRLNDAVLTKFISTVLASQSREKLREFLCGLLSPPKVDGPSLMEVDKPQSSFSKSPRSGRKLASQSQLVLPEVEVYAQLLLLIYFIDQFRLDKAEECGKDLVTRIEAYNRRSLDPLAARVYFYYSLIAEKIGDLDRVRSFFHSRLRTATLHHETESQAVLINSLMRGYLREDRHDLAGKLVEKAVFPESANNNEWARHFYYLGLIKAMELEYTKAEKYLEQAMRKAPQHGAVGFKQSVQKSKIVVDLLLGTIPERSTFRQPIFRKTLAPYLQLTQAVRIGDVQRFKEVLEKYGHTSFKQDGTYSLIVRLRQNVIKTAVKQIALAYNRISVSSAQNKLQLTHPDEADYTISKLIKEGVIEASMNYEGRYLQSADTADVYSTMEPQHQYHTRIAFCLELYNQAVKAMRFPPKSYSKDVESAEEQREREQQELEFAKEMAEDDDDFP